MRELRCDKDIFIRELEANKDLIEREDWNGFFAAVKNNIANQQSSKVMYLIPDYIKLLKEEGFDVIRELREIYFITITDDVLDDVDLRNAEVIHTRGIIRSQGSILLSRKLRSIEYRAFSACDPFTIKFEGSKEEWDRIPKNKTWHSWPITIQCSDEKWEEEGQNC